MPVHNQKILDFYQVAQERDFTRQFQFRVTEISDRGAAIVTRDDLLPCLIWDCLSMYRVLLIIQDLIHTQSHLDLTVSKS